MSKDTLWCPGCLQHKEGDSFVSTMQSRTGKRLICKECEKLLPEIAKFAIKRRVQSVYSQIKRAEKIGLAVNWNDELWTRCIQYWESKCVVCGSTRRLVPDHWIPLGDGSPGTVPENIIPLCDRCNAGKQRRNAYHWLRGRVGERKAKLIIEKIHQYFRWITESK